MSRFKHGEYMNICWDGGSPDAYYVYGHVPFDVFWAALANYGVEQNEAGAPEHGWARCNPDPSGEHRWLLGDATGPGPGCFPVTTALSASMERSIRSLRRLAEETTAALLRALPGVAVRPGRSTQLGTASTCADGLMVRSDDPRELARLLRRHGVEAEGAPHAVLLGAAEQKREVARVG